MILVWPQPIPVNNNAKHIREFFDDIGSVRNLAARSTRPSGFEIKNFFTGAKTCIGKAEHIQRRLDQREATGFNVFALIQPDENRLSDILSDLLDPKGAHGQNEIFLQSFFEKLGFAKDTVSRTATVQREAPTYHNLQHCRRIDILVDAGILLAIENKIDSRDRPSQVPDYLQHLLRCFKRTGKKHVLVYLTPDCRKPEFENLQHLKTAMENGVLKCWSYQKHIRAWLEECRRQCVAPKIQYLLSDFISYIDTSIQREPSIGTEQTDET